MNEKKDPNWHPLPKATDYMEDVEIVKPLIIGDGVKPLTVGHSELLGEETSGNPAVPIGVHKPMTERWLRSLLDFAVDSVLAGCTREEIINATVLKWKQEKTSGSKISFE